ncbi:MAG: glutaredoxin domain-containing protein [Candidatus Paceibacterota bacterium]
MKKVQIFSTPSCVYCVAAKNFFKENHIEYEEFNVAEDMEKRTEMIKRSGQMGVPVIIIENDIVVGFNKDKVANLLGL